MLKTIKVFAVAVLALMAYSLPAQAREFAAIYEDCGLGAMIAPHNPGVAAVTNVTWDLGTTAISSNITTPDTCAGGKEKTAAFIHESYESLASDLSSGSGAYLDTLMVLAGVDTQSKQQFTESLRADFAAEVARPDYSAQTRFEKAKALYNIVFKNS